MPLNPPPLSRAAAAARLISFFVMPAVVMRLASIPFLMKYKSDKFAGDLAIAVLDECSRRAAAKNKEDPENGQEEGNGAAQCYLSRGGDLQQLLQIH